MPSGTARRVRAIAVTVLLVAVLVQTTVHLHNYFTERVEAYSVNAERTVFVAAAVVTLMAVALGCLRVAWSGSVGRAHGAVLAGIVTFLAVDEYFIIHERIGMRAARLLGLAPDWGSVLWPILYVPLLGVVLVGLLLFAHRAPVEVARMIVVGLGLLLLAVVLEVLSTPFSTVETAGGVVHALGGGLEEAFELAGWGLIAIALHTWVPAPRDVPGGAGRLVASAEGARSASS